MEKQFYFNSAELADNLKDFSLKGITELSVHDENIANDKGLLRDFLLRIQKNAPELFVSIKINPKILDQEICSLLSSIRSSVEMDFVPSDKGFDKKFYSRKCALLDNFGVLFGVSLYFAASENDSLKSFKERLDFSVAQYPNHIDFPQLESDDDENLPRVSGFFSAEDIRAARNIAFSCRTFYSAGRAVSWFNSVLQALRIQPSVFFADFAEWQRVNNCDFRSGFVPEDEKHSKIEEMQLLFLEMKLEEKGKGTLIPCVKDIVKINGALSRLTAEGEEATIDFVYNPEDLFGPESVDMVSFSNDVCMEHCRVKIFLESDGEPNFMVLNS